MNLCLKEKELIEVSKHDIESIAILPPSQGSKIILGDRNKKVYLVHLSNDLVNTSSKVLKAYDEQHRKRVTDVEYSPEGDKIISVSADNQMIIWDKETKQCFKTTGHNRTITSVTINSACNKIVTGSEDCSFALWNTLGKQIAIFDKSIEHSHKSWVNDVGFVPNSKDILVTASEDGTVKIWDLDANVLLKTFFKGMVVDYEKAKENKTPVQDFDFECAVKAIAFSKDGSLLAYGGRNSKVYILNLNKGELLLEIDVQAPVTALSYGETQPLIAIAVPNKVLIWNIFESKMVGDYTFASKGESYCRSLGFVGDEIVAGLEGGKVARIEVSKN